MSVRLEERAPANVSSAAKPTKKAANEMGMLDLWSLRHLIGVMVKREFVGQYKGSMAGMAWAVINPLGHLLLYTFVFSVILKVRFGAHGGVSNFALYLMAALLPWGAFAQALTNSTSSVTSQPNLVKRVVFPLEVLPLSSVCSALLTCGVGLSLLCVVAACMGYPPKVSLIYLPLLFGSQFLLTSGLCWILASLGVYLQDLRHLMSLALSTWMYASPVVYPASAFPANLKFMLWINPMAGLITDYRRVILEGMPPDWPLFATYTTLGILAWFGGYYFFSKTKRSFADVI